MTKTKQIVNEFNANGIVAAEQKANELNVGFYKSEFNGFELWQIRNGQWVKQIYVH